MRIAVFIPTLRGAGAERVVINLCNGFIDAGYKVDLVVGLLDGAFAENKLWSEEVQLYALGVQRIRYAFIPLIKYLRSSQADVLVSHLTRNNLLVLLLIKCLRIHSMPVIVVEHNTITEDFKSLPVLKRLLFTRLSKWLYNYADYCVAVSRASAQALAQFAHISPARLRTIYNPVVDSRLYEQAAKTVMHPWFAQPQHEPVILTVSRLVPAKNIALLITAFAEVRKSLSCRLLILGEGEERSSLEVLIRKFGLEDSVEMPGFVDNPYAYMSKSKIFVLASNYEGLPTVLIESLASGCPVVATDSPGGVREILADGRYGVLVPVNDQYALAEALKKVLKGEYPCTKEEYISQAAHFSVKNAVAAYQDIIYASLNKATVC